MSTLRLPYYQTRITIPVIGACSDMRDPVSGFILLIGGRYDTDLCHAEIIRSAEAGNYNYALGICFL